MATRIKVEGDHCTVTLSEPDEDGDYYWIAECDAVAEFIQPIEDAIANAEVHIEYQCPRLPMCPEVRR